MPLGAGTSVGPYDVLGVLGAGAMGTVYRARDRRLGREVALKMLHGEDDDPDARRRRILHEARAASSLNHPNICQIYDVGEVDDTAWIAMEFVEGEPLQAAIPAHGLPAATVVKLAVQLSEALAHAHERGVLHRDLKTANVALTRDGRPKVLDFGLAASLPGKVAAAVTRTSASIASDEGVSGTVPYMAPEILVGGAADERSDLWSLGVTLYEMATGERPFRGQTQFEVGAAILEQAPAPLPANVPPAVARVIMRLLEKRPQDRYAHASEVAAVLESILRDGQEARRPARASSTAARRTIGAALAVVAGLSAFGWWWARPRSLSLTDEHPATLSAGSHRFPSYSPDGSMLAFVAPDTNGIEQVWIKHLGQSEAIRISTAEADAARPRWSPTNDQIVFGVGGGGIWSVSPLGGNARRILDQGANPNFSRDGSRLVYEREGVIWTAAVDGSAARRVDGIQQRYYNVPGGPAFSPDGRSIAYFLPENGPLGDLWVIDAAGGTPRRITSDLAEGGWPAWTNDGRSIVFSSARAGSRTLWQIRADGGGSPVPLTTGAGEDDQPDIAADGRHLAYSNTRSHWELRVRDLATNREGALFNRPIPILFPMFSPDGSRILFFGYADYAVAIFTVRTDGSDFRQLTSGREVNHEPRWGGDGKSIYFFQTRPTQTFRRMSAEGGVSTEFRRWRWETENAPMFDPSGRFVAYTRQRAPGARAGPRDATIIEQVETGSQRELPGEHMHVRQWSADGTSILGWRHDGKAWTCRVADFACRPIADGSLPVWSADEQRVFVVRPEHTAAPQEVWSVKMDGTDERLVASLGRFRQNQSILRRLERRATRLEFFHRRTPRGVDGVHRRASLTRHHEHWAPTACRTVAVSARHYRRRRRNDRHHRDVVVRARTPPLAPGRQSVTLS